MDLSGRCRDARLRHRSQGEDASLLSSARATIQCLENLERGADSAATAFPRPVTGNARTSLTCRLRSKVAYGRQALPVCSCTYSDEPFLGAWPQGRTGDATPAVASLNFEIPDVHLAPSTNVLAVEYCPITEPLLRGALRWGTRFSAGHGFGRWFSSRSRGCRHLAAGQLYQIINKVEGGVRATQIAPVSCGIHRSAAIIACISEMEQLRDPHLRLDADGFVGRQRAIWCFRASLVSQSHPRRISLH